MALEAATASIYYRDKIKCIVDGMKASLEIISDDLDMIGTNITKSCDAVRYEIAKRIPGGPRTNIWREF